MSANEITWDKFVAELFEFEYCDECGGGEEDHELWVVQGNWFAHCKQVVLP